MPRSDARSDDSRRHGRSSSRRPHDDDSDSGRASPRDRYLSTRDRERSSRRRRGADEGDDDASSAAGGFGDDAANPAWAVRSGTVGDYLQHSASPMEVKLFEEFVSLMDVWEKKHGIAHKRGKHAPRNEGVHVSLGMNLRAEVRFYVA